MVQSIYTTVIQDRFTTWTEQSMWFLAGQKSVGQHKVAAWARKWVSRRSPAKVCRVAAHSVSEYEGAEYVLGRQSGAAEYLDAGGSSSSSAQRRQEGSARRGLNSLLSPAQGEAPALGSADNN